MLNFNAALRDRRALDITGSQLHTVHGQPPTKLPCDACAARRRRITAVAAFWRSARTCVPSGVGAAAAAAAGALELQPPCCSVATPLDSALRNCDCGPPGCCSAMSRTRGLAGPALRCLSPIGRQVRVTPRFTPPSLPRCSYCSGPLAFKRVHMAARHRRGGPTNRGVAAWSGCGGIQGVCAPSQEQSAAQGSSSHDCAAAIVMLGGAPGGHTDSHSSGPPQGPRTGGLGGAANSRGSGGARWHNAQGKSST